MREACTRIGERAMNPSDGDFSGGWHDGCGFRKRWHIGVNRGLVASGVEASMKDLPP